MQHLKILLFVLSIAIVFATKAVAQVDITYNPENGNLSVNSPERTITTFEAISAENLFIPGNVQPGVIVHPFGMITPAKLFKLSLGPVGKVNGAYNSIDFGNILPARLPNQQLAADLTIAGTLTPDGSGNNALDANGINLSWLPRFQPVSVNYQTATGNLTVESPDRTITAFEMISTGSNLNPAGAAPGTFDSPPDILNETRLYKFSEGDAAYNSINFGNVLKPGMSYPEFVADMAFDGAFTPDAPGDTNTALNAHGLNVNWIPGPQPAGPGVTVSYDPPTGNLSVNSPDRTITTFQTISAGNQFIPENVTPGTVAPPFDIITPEKLFKLSAGANAYNSIDFGNVLPTGLLNSQLEADLSIDGSLTPDGSGNNSLDAGGLNVCLIPEPSGIVLLSLGFLTLLGFARRQGNPTR